MKKKLLSLVLAGAMVASTSVSAFAADTATHKETSIQEGRNEQEVPVDITGNILDEHGNKVPGTIKVTVPTATTFSVGHDGGLTSPQMTISNDGDEQIIVVASKFVDANGSERIDIVKRTDFERTGQDQNERNKIWLRLKSGNVNVGLVSANKGEMYDNEYVNKIEEEQGCPIGKIAPGNNMTLELEGLGGTKEGSSNDAIKDTFKLVLKVKRDRNV